MSDLDRIAQGAMKPLVLTVTTRATPAAEQVIAEGLRRYNRE
jgi:hypothetical protein